MPDIDLDLDDDDELLAGLADSIREGIDVDALTALASGEGEAEEVDPQDAAESPEEAVEKPKFEGADDLESLLTSEFTPAGETSGLDAPPPEAPKTTTTTMISEEHRPFSPEPSAAGDYMSTRSAEGVQEPLGLEDTRQDLVAEARRVASLYNDPRYATRPQAHEAGEYEKEFMAGNTRPTDADFRKQWIMGLLFGDKEDLAKNRDFLVQQRQQYDEGLMKARGMDRHGGRVSQGVAELLVLGGMTPEAAVQLRADDPAVELARSLGSQGIRLRGQDTTKDNASLAAFAKILENMQSNQVGFDNKTRQLQNNLDVANLYAKKKAGAGDGGPAMDPAEAKANYIARQNKTTLDVARKLLDGTLGPNDATPAQVEAMNQTGISWDFAKPKEKQQLMKQLEGKVGTELRAPEVRAAIESRSPKQLMDLSTRMQGMGVPLKQADRAWRNLKTRSPNIASAITKMGLGTNFENAVKSQMTPEDFADFQAVKKQILAAAKAASGAAITASEAPNLASAFGMAMADENQFFNDPATLTSFLDNSVSEYNTLADSVIQFYPSAMDWARPKKKGP